MSAINVSHAEPHTIAGSMLILLQGPRAPHYLHAWGLHLSTSPLPLYSTSLTTCEFCAGQKSVRGASRSQGGKWAGYEAQEFPIFTPAPCRILLWPHSQLSLPAHRFCCVTMSDPVTRGVFVEHRWDYTVRISIVYPELLKLVSSHPAGDVVYLAGICKHTSRASEADLSTWKVSAHHTAVLM